MPYKAAFIFYLGLYLLINTPASRAGDFIPRLAENPALLKPSPDNNGNTNGYILTMDDGLVEIGAVPFAGSTLKIFGKSPTTQSTDGRDNFSEHGWKDLTIIDNPVFREFYMSCPNPLARTYRLSVKDLQNGVGIVELEFRFIDEPVTNLHLVVFDVDEVSGSAREKVFINAYSSLSPTRANKVDARNWRIVAQGDLSLFRKETNEQMEPALPPYWYAIKPGTLDNFGLLQTRKRRNQNRDFTVLTMSEAIQLLRVRYSGPRPEAGTTIGSHVYIGLWHENQPCN